MWRNNREQLFPAAKTSPGRFDNTWRTPHAKWFTAYRDGCKGWGVVAVAVLEQPCAGVCRKPRSPSLGFQCGWPLLASICTLVLSLVQVCGKGRVGEGVGKLLWSTGLNIVSAIVQVSLFSITVPRCVCASCHLECFTVCVMAEGRQLTELLLRFCTVL